MQNTNDTTRTASFALYRLPHESECHVLRAEPQEFAGVAATAGRTGFVMAPFAAGGDLPTLFYEGEAEAQPIPPAGPSGRACAPAGPMTAEYLSDFERLHGEVVSGRLRKVVLARSRAVSLSGEHDAKALFANACAAYPQAFVALVRTPRLGTWLIATPELLVESHAGRLRTVALAGTMRRGGSVRPEWSRKNREEQAVVSRYVGDSIAHLATDCETGDTETIASGDLLHLVTTFRFGLPAGATVADVAAALHPTPAVCGMPKEAALRAISRTEHCRREYYSGFAGPVGANGDADLYVTLRCAKIEGRECTLFAGGGLMPESDAREEWDETEAKMETVVRVL